jgi:hypothetical protein
MAARVAWRGVDCSQKASSRPVISSWKTASRTTDAV